MPSEVGEKVGEAGEMPEVGLKVGEDGEYRCPLEAALGLAGEYFGLAGE